MIDKFVKAWDANKSQLKAYLSSHKMRDYDQYELLVKALFKEVINPYLAKCDDDTFDLSRMTIIDDGQYQGTYLFIIPKDTYQPCYDDYVMTYSYYGSCSGCDAILAITDYEDNALPDEKQANEFFTLCLHLLQHCIYPYQNN